MNPLSLVSTAVIAPRAPIRPTPQPVTRWCWKCRRTLPDDAFHLTRCLECTQREDVESTARLAWRMLRSAHAISSPDTRRILAWRALARAVERQAEREGIQVTIPEQRNGEES